MVARSPLPRALRANALVSLVTGLAGLLMSAPLTQTIGLIQGTSYQVLGGVLVAHTVSLLWASGRARRATWTRLNIGALTLLVLVALGVLAFGAISTPLGRGLIAAVAALYSALALWQLRLVRISAPQPAQ